MITLVLCDHILALPYVQVTSEMDDDALHLHFENSGASMDAATLAAFCDAEAENHASRDPFTRMRTGLRFAAHLLRFCGGALTASQRGAPDGRRAGGAVVVTVTLPRRLPPERSAPTLRLPGGVHSGQELADEEVAAALRNARLQVADGAAAPAAAAAAADDDGDALPVRDSRPRLRCLTVGHARRAPRTPNNPICFLEVHLETYVATVPERFARAVSRRRVRTVLPSHNAQCLADASGRYYHYIP